MRVTTRLDNSELLLKPEMTGKAKIFAGDVITEIVPLVDDKGRKIEDPKPLSTKGMSTQDAVKNILGPEGTPVRLVIQREGEDKPLEFNLIRGKVEVESVMGHKRNDDDTWNYVVDPENKICSPGPPSQNCWLVSNMKLQLL